MNNDMKTYIEGKEEQFYEKKVVPDTERAAVCNDLRMCFGGKCV